MPSIKDSLKNSLSSIDDAAHLFGKKTDDICLVAVSKTKPVEMIEEAYEAGDIGMLRGAINVDDIYLQTVNSLQNNIERCFRRMVFWGQCYIY